MPEPTKDQQSGHMSSTPVVNRRSLIAGTGAALAGAVVSGTASAKASKVFSAPAVIQNRKVIPLFTVENDPKSLAFYEETLRQFQEQIDPNVDIEVSVYQDENILQFVGTAFQTGTDLGIFSSFESHVEGWAEQGYLLELDSIVERVGEADFLPGTRAVVDGHDYVMPAQANASALWVRLDLLESEGLSLPTNYDELVATIEAVHGKDGVVGISSGVGTVPNLTTQFFSPYLYQSGWDVFDVQGNLTFNQPAVLDAVNRWAGVLQFTSPSMYNTTYPDISNLFASGRAAFATFPGRLGVNVAENAPDLAETITVMPIPAGPFMTQQLHFGGASPFSIYANTAHPEEAKAFLEFMLTGQRLLELAMTVPGHLLPPLESVRALVPGYESEFMANHGDWVVTLNDLVPQAMSPDSSMGSVNNGQFLGKMNNHCPWGARVWGTDPVDGRMFQKILIEGVNAEQAWTEANEELATIREEWLTENPDWEPNVAAPPAG